MNASFGARSLETATPVARIRQPELKEMRTESETVGFCGLGISIPFGCKAVQGLKEIERI